MKKIMIIALAATAFTSCQVKNNYSLHSLSLVGHDQTTSIDTTANWEKGQIVVVNGREWKVDWINH